MNPEEIIHKIGTSEERIEFATTPARVFILIAQLQLALRHPHNTGSSAAIAHNLSQAICHHIPEAATLIEMGWHEGYDVTRQYFDAEFR
jgi:hypothetical protein